MTTGCLPGELATVTPGNESVTSTVSLPGVFGWLPLIARSVLGVRDATA